MSLDGAKLADIYDPLTRELFIEEAKKLYESSVVGKKAIPWEQLPPQSQSAFIDEALSAGSLANKLQISRPDKREIQ